MPLIEKIEEAIRLKLALWHLLGEIEKDIETDFLESIIDEIAIGYNGNLNLTEDEILDLLDNPKPV